MGLVPRGSTVSYIEELENAEGRWLRLTEESVLVHTKTDSPSQVCIVTRSLLLDQAQQIGQNVVKKTLLQAWVIQFHRALDRVLIDIGNGMKSEHPMASFPPIHFWKKEVDLFWLSLKKMMRKTL